MTRVIPPGVEALLEPQPQVLEPIERALRARLVLGLVASREAERFGFDPRHVARSLVAARSVVSVCAISQIPRSRRGRLAPEGSSTWEDA
jgi:hypothetical protein